MVNLQVDYNEVDTIIYHLKNSGNTVSAKQLEDILHSGLHRFNNLPSKCIVCGATRRATEGIEKANGDWL